jgi:aspartyl-tRNA(Asn)/glutamyl-tRNA(Gln) amidotransferase subunit A
MYLADVFTIAANLAGICGISVPCGFAKTEEGTELPIGMQLLGKPLDEERILQIAHGYEQSSPWHKKKPPLARNVQPIPRSSGQATSDVQL